MTRWHLLACACAFVRGQLMLLEEFCAARGRGLDSRRALIEALVEARAKVRPVTVTTPAWWARGGEA